MAAFRGTLTPYHSAGTSIFPHWVQVGFPTQASVSKYRIWAANVADTKDAPIDWTLQRSDDATNGPWTVVDQRVNSEPPNNPVPGGADVIITRDISHGEYTITLPRPFKFCRLNVTKTGGGTANRTTILQLAEVELIGTFVSTLGEPEPEVPKLVELP